MIYVFVFLVAGILVYMFVDGLLTSEVWVRGARSGFSLSEWAHKRSRLDEPVSYWFFMSLYAIGALWLVYLVLLA